MKEIMDVLTSDIVFGSILLAVMLTIILWMIWYNLKMVRDECIKDNRAKFDKLVRLKANAMYRRKLMHTKYHVVQPVRFVNESNINWGRLMDEEV